MLRLSKLTDYAVVVLVRLSRFDAVATSPVLAQATGVPEPTVAKVLKALCASGLVLSTRGARGGYRLARSLDTIPVSAVIAAIDGPISLAACVEGSNGCCEAENSCPIRGSWDPVNEAIRQVLNAITLDRMQVPARMEDGAPGDARRKPPPAPIGATSIAATPSVASHAAE